MNVNFPVSVTLGKLLPFCGTFMVAVSVVALMMSDNGHSRMEILLVYSPPAFVVHSRKYARGGASHVWLRVGNYRSYITRNT